MKVLLLEMERQKQRMDLKLQRMRLAFEDTQMM